MIMSKKEETKKILSMLGMPAKQQTDICCYSLLSLLHLGSSSAWSSATNEWTRIHDVLQFLRTNYRGVRYAENSRETFRKEAMHHFVAAAIIEDNSADTPTNSPNRAYRVTTEALELFKAFNSSEWDARLSEFLAAHKTLKEIYASKKVVGKVAVKIGGVEYALSTGSHNRLQKAVIEEFAPRFLRDFTCLYLGDSSKRDLIKDIPMLESLGFSITLHDKMPDVVFNVADKHWVVFVECVTSVGPMSAARVHELNAMTRGVSSGKVFITAFLDRKTYKKFSDQIAWETDVWIAEDPDHMIHLNGDRFMGPHNSAT